MLQVRGRDGDDRRWWSPERDVVYAFPRVFRKSLDAFNEFKGNDRASLEEVGKACQQFARVVNACREGGVLPTQVRGMLKGIHEGAFDTIARAFLFTFFGEFLIWCSEAKPKAPGDAPLGLEEVEEFLGIFARSAMASGSDDAGAVEGNGCTVPGEQDAGHVLDSGQ
jgi:hypothetical protein